MQEHGGIGIEWHLQYPLDERQTGNGPLLVLAENATADALFQPQGSSAPDRGEYRQAAGAIAQGIKVTLALAKK